MSEGKQQEVRERAREIAAKYFGTKGNLRVQLAAEIEAVALAAQPAHQPAAAPVAGAPERKIGNRFVIRNNELVKLATGEVLPEWEPLFLFRARDYLALPALLRLREAYVQDGCTEYLLSLMDETIEAFRRFTVEHPEWMKQPGVTKGKVFTPAPVATEETHRCDTPECKVEHKGPKLSIGTPEQATGPTIRVNNDGVWLLFADKNKGSAALDIEEYAVKRGGIVGEVIKNWCDEQREAALGQLPEGK